MRRTSPLISLLLAVLLALGASATARGASPDQIIRDCTNSESGYLTGTYTKGDLRRAATRVTGDIAEYTGCYDAIRRALSARASSNRGTDDANAGGGGGGSDFSDGSGGGVGGSNGSGGSGDGSTGGFDEDDEVVVGGGAPENAAPVTPQPGSDRPVNLAGTTIRPGSIPSIGREANALPGAMTVFLVLLGVGALGAVATTIGRRVLARRSA